MFHTCLCPFLFSYIFPVFFSWECHSRRSLLFFRGLRDNLELSPEFEDVEMSDLEQRRRKSLQVHLSKALLEIWFWESGDFGKVCLQSNHFWLFTFPDSAKNGLSEMMTLKILEGQILSKLKNIGIKRLELLLLVIFADDKSTAKNSNQNPPLTNLSSSLPFPVNFRGCLVLRNQCT